MEPILEIISKNIVYNKKYSQKLKDEYITTINRIQNIKTNIMQLYRSMDYQLLYNILYDEILYLIKQQKYFNEHLDTNVKFILDEYLSDRIQLYKDHMNKLQ